MDAERRIVALEVELAAKDARIAERDARIAELTAQVAALSAQVAALTERLNRNSGNSNEPPSSDAPSVRAARSGNGSSGGKRGGPPGHRGSQRALLPREQVDEFLNVLPPQCENCLPTNNHAEQQGRPFMLWRKRSYGTQSERGDHFAERLMTVAHTARMQGENVLSFLTECCTAARMGVAPPSLSEA